MEFGKRQILGISVAIAGIVAAFIFLRETDVFYFVVGISLVIGGLPFLITVVVESKKEKENNKMFLEFARDLVENVKSGTPISKSIINLRSRYYGTLTPHIKKMSNQISLGIPVQKALETFADDVKSSVVGRAVGLIGEAQKAGGEIGKILESVAESVNETENLKKERKKSVYNLIVQGYIIFFIFIIIMLIMQFKIVPMASELAGGSGFGGGGALGIGGGTIGSGGGSEGISQEEITRPLLYLLIAQGFFAGLVIGKLAEGKVKDGIKHSFALASVSLIIHAGMQIVI